MTILGVLSFVILKSSPHPQKFGNRGFNLEVPQMHPKGQIWLADGLTWSPSAPAISGCGPLALRAGLLCRHPRPSIPTVWHPPPSSMGLPVWSLRHWFLENLSLRFSIRIYSPDIPLLKLVNLIQKLDLWDCLFQRQPIFYLEPVSGLFGVYVGRVFFPVIPQDKHSKEGKWLLP